MWIVIDFPTYKMVFGKLACLYCMHNNKVFTLINYGKAFFFHKRFFPSHHRFKNNKKEFLKDKVGRDIIASVLSGEELYNKVSKYEGIAFDFHYEKKKFFGFGVTHN